MLTLNKTDTQTKNNFTLLIRSRCKASLSLRMMERLSTFIETMKTFKMPDLAL